MLMKTFLRFSLLSMLLMLCGNLMAQTVVTIDFDNDYEALFPTLAGVSQGTDGHDGDFTAPTTSTPVQGVMVIVSPDEEATTPSRIWSSSPRLRMYSGTFSVVGDGITKIEFIAHSKNFNLTALNGTLDGYTWTGDEDMVLFSVVKNTQISKIVVTMGGEVGPGPVDDEGFEYLSGNITETDNQIVFDFTATDKKKQVDVTGQMVFDFENNLCTRAVVSVTYPTEASAQAGYQDALADKEEGEYDEVTLSGCIVTAVATTQYAGNTKEVIKKLLNMLLGHDVNILTGDGTLANPFTPSDANFMASVALQPGDTSDESYYIKGKIAAIKYTFNSQFGTATFFISEDGSTEAEQFQCYSVYYLENKSWVDGYTQIKEGDDVIIYGKLTNYQGTPETASRQAYIYSLNGVTKAEGGDTPDPQVQLVSVSKALEIIDALENGKTTAEIYQVKGYVISVTEISTSFGNATFIMADSKTDKTGLTVYRCKGFNGESITDEQLLKEGDEVVVEGKLQKYVKNDVVTPEVATGGHIVSINGQDSGVSGITVDAAPAVVYNLQGQRVANVQKGLYIVNGRKVVMK